MSDTVLKYGIGLVAFELSSLFEYHIAEQSQKKLVDQAVLLYQGYKSFGQGIFLASFFLVFEESSRESLELGFGDPALVHLWKSPCGLIQLKEVPTCNVVTRDQVTGPRPKLQHVSATGPRPVRHPSHGGCHDTQSCGRVVAMRNRADE